MNNQIGIVFIHGAGLNGSIWDELLKEISIPSLVIDFPNRKNGREIDILTFDDYVSAATNQIRNWEKDHFIIVAHSIGACIGLKIANNFKAELKGFVAVGSVIPKKNGKSFISSLPFPQQFIMPIIIRLFGTKPPKKSIVSELCNDLTAEQTKKIVNEFTPESKSLYITKINFSLPEINRLYVKLKNDKSMSLTLQDKMAINLNANRIITMDSGHLPMLSKAKPLAVILSDFVNEID